MKTLVLAALLLPALSFAQSGEIQRGTVLLLDRVDKTAHVPVPRRGQSMATVESRYGAPDQRVGPVGSPPITRWVYSDFTVYFESNRVIHAVVNKASDSESLGP